jgi:hypothetical protein
MSNDPAVRRNTAKQILSRYWPNHYIIWINGVEDYNQINWLMSFKDKEDIIICQTEEDWFYSHSVESMRKRIAASEHWTANSFIITNSIKDWEISHKLIKTEVKPGILDLISYLPYNESLVNFNSEDINFYTSYLYDHKRFGRNELANVLEKNIDKIAVLKTFEKKIANLKNLDNSVFFVGKQDAPNVSIEQDYHIFKHCAFVVAFETFNGLPGEKINNNNFQMFSPTLSEKTYKAIHMLRPAIVFGGHNSKSYLNSLGFDTWDWLIDWTFDKEKNPYLRLNLFLKEIDRLLSIDLKDLKSIIESNIDKLNFNRERLKYLIENYDKNLFKFN